MLHGAVVEVRGGVKTAPRYFGRRPEVAYGGPAPQALNFGPSCERRGGAATVLESRDRGEQSSQNPVLFGWLLAYGAQNRPAAATCCGGRCLRWCCVCFPAALLAAAAAPAAAAAADAPAATPFAGGLHLLLQCFPGFLLFPLWCFLCRRPCSSPPSHSKIRSSNRHAMALGSRKRRRHRRPFSRAARPGAISFLQEVNLYREIEATKRAF